MSPDNFQWIFRIVAPLLFLVFLLLLFSFRLFRMRDYEYGLSDNEKARRVQIKRLQATATIFCIAWASSGLFVLWGQSENCTI